MQMLIHNTTNDPAAWKDVFETDREAQGAAGLSLLQMWHAEGDPNSIWLLFEISDRDRAQSWVDAPQSALHATRAGIIDSSVHFLELA